MNKNVKAKAKVVEWKKRSLINPLVRPLYSSVIIGDGAIGGQSLFTTPLGQPIVTMGARIHTGRIYTERTTSVDKAGEIGSNFGNVLLRGLSYDFPDGCSAKHQRQLEQQLVVKLRIAGKWLFETPITELPVLFDPPVPLEQTESVVLHVEIGTDVPLKLVHTITEAEQVFQPVQPAWRQRIWELLGIPSPSPSYRYHTRKIPAAVLVRFTFDATATPGRS